MNLGVTDPSRYFENKDCAYHPCHKGLEHLNCLFCYCPLYLRRGCPGTPVYIESAGRRIKDCSGCTFPHRPENYDRVIQALSDVSEMDER